METIIQAFTGGFDSAPVYSDIAEKLVVSVNNNNAQTVIIGWNPDVSYADAISKLHDLKKDVYLWLPVFSEYGKEAVTALDFSGEKHTQAITAADDDFTFACPHNPVNIKLAASYYDKHFRGYRFDGVFLDKIRFSSFGNGFRSGIGCFCRECLEFYDSEGIDTGTLKELLESKSKEFLAPNTLRGMRYAFENSLIDSFFKARAKLITESVKKVIVMFRERELKIGLDVFAPPFSYWVGQDIDALACIADFIKPMIYRVTDAPAGMPFEQKRMTEELAINGCNIGGVLETLWDTDDLTSGGCFENQLRLLEKMPCRIYSGLEVNKSEICNTDAAYVENTIKAIKESGIAGCVLSWNVLAENCLSLGNCSGGVLQCSQWLQTAHKF